MSDIAWLKRVFAVARGACQPSPTLTEQVQAILTVNGFIRFDVTEGHPVAVTLHRGHYRADAHLRLTLAQMSNRLMDYGLLVETRDNRLYVSRRGCDRD